MNNSSFLELLQTMRNKQALEKDFLEIAAATRTMLHDKYINRLRSAIHAQNMHTRENPPKEARLLEAFKPFVPEEQHAALDKASQAILTLDACRRISGQMSAQVHTAEVDAKAPPDPSIHKDGVYDIDSQCARKQGINPSAAHSAGQPPATMMMLLMMFMMEDMQ